MVRIAGIDLPQTKIIEISLTYIYGIGRAKSKEILALAGIDPQKKTKSLLDEEVGKIRELIERSYTTESDLKRLETLSIKRLIEINCFRGRRHINSLPVRGQRTRTNAQTRKRIGSKGILKRRKP